MSLGLLEPSPFNVNVFCHQPARSAPVVEAAWIDRLRPEFNRLGAAPPTALTEIYKSFVEDDDMLAALLADKPKVVSFHFGARSSDRVQALRNAGIVLLGSAQASMRRGYLWQRAFMPSWGRATRLAAIAASSTPTPTTTGLARWR